MDMEMGVDVDYEGIYVISRGEEYGLMELHEWIDWFDESELKDPEPDGAWYCEYRIGEDIDGCVLGYRYGDTLDDLQEVCGIQIIARIGTPDMDGYDGLIDWIQAQGRESQ